MKTSSPIYTAIAADPATAASIDPLLKTSTELSPLWIVQPSPNNYYINSVALSGDGARVVAGTFYHNYGETADPTRRPTLPVVSLAADPLQTFGTYCYDNAGRLLWKDEFQGWQGVYWVDISTNGAWAAAGGWFSQNPYAGFVRAYDASTGQQVLNYATTARVNQVVLSADGTWLASAANTLVLFQRVNGVYQKVDEYNSPAARDTVETIAMSPDGKTLVAGDYAGQIMLFSINNGKLGTPVTWKVPDGGYSHSVRMAADGKSFAAGGSDGNFYLFNVANFIANGVPSTSYQVPNAGSVYGVAVAADGSAFVGIVNVPGGTGCTYCVNSDGTLLWSYATEHNPNSACFNSLANVVAVADGHPDGCPGIFYFIDATTGVLRGQYGTSNMSWPILISADGKSTVAGSDDSNVYFFKTP